MVKFKPGWDNEKAMYANKYGSYQAYLDSFKEAAILKALYDAKRHFNGQWVNNFLNIATDPFNSQVITIEQGTHQVENTTGGGFCLHFTGRDNGGFAFHFYVNQNKSGQLNIFEISYNDRGIKIFRRFG